MNERKPAVKEENEYDALYSRKKHYIQTKIFSITPVTLYSHFPTIYLSHIYVCFFFSETIGKERNFPNVLSVLNRGFALFNIVNLLQINY